MAATYQAITKVDISGLVTPGAWQTIDIASYVSNNIKAVHVLFENTNLSTAYASDIRKTDSTDSSIYSGLYYGSYKDKICGVKSNGAARQVDIFIPVTDVKVYIIGEMLDNVEFLTNAVQKTLGSLAWIDVDVSGDFTETAKVVFGETINTSATTEYGTGSRKNGASDSFTQWQQRSSRYTFCMEAASEVIEVWCGNATNILCFVIGIVTTADEQFEFLAARTTLTGPGSTGVWTDLAGWDLLGRAVARIINVDRYPSTTYLCTTRDENGGKVELPYTCASLFGEDYIQCADNNGDVEAKVSNTSGVTYREVGVIWPYSLVPKRSNKFQALLAR